MLNALKILAITKEGIMKIWETKVRQYDVANGPYGLSVCYRTYINVRVYKLFGIVIWRKVLD